MNKKLFQNFIYQGSYQVLLILMPIITIPIISRNLGPHGIGTWNYINSIVTYFILVASLGLSSYGVREIALAKRDKKKLSTKFWELELFNAFFSMGTLVIYILFSSLMKERILFLIQGLAVLSSLFDISWFFAGIEDFKKVSLVNFFVKIISFICIVLFINSTEDLWKYFLIQSCSMLLSQLSFWLFLKGKVYFVKVSLQAIWMHFRPALNFFIAKVAGTVFFNVNKTILGLFLSMTIVGYFSNALSMIWIATNLIASINTVMIPRMSSMYGEKDNYKMDKLLENVIHFQLFMTILLAFGIITTNEKMVIWFFGSEFSAITTIVPLVAPVVVLQSLHSGIAQQYLIPKGEIKAYNQTIIIATIFTVLVDASLIPILGIYGAVIGLLLGEILVTILRANSLLKESSFKFRWNSIISYVFSGLIMYIITNYLTKDLKATMITTLLQIVLATIIYMIFTTILQSNPISLIIIEKLKGYNNDEY